MYTSLEIEVDPARGHQASSTSTNIVSNWYIRYLMHFMVNYFDEYVSLHC